MQHSIFNTRSLVQVHTKFKKRKHKSDGFKKHSAWNSFSYKMNIKSSISDHMEIVFFSKQRDWHLFLSKQRNGNFFFRNKGIHINTFQNKGIHIIAFKKKGVPSFRIRCSGWTLSKVMARPPDFFLILHVCQTGCCQQWSSVIFQRSVLWPDTEKKSYENQL